MSLSKPLLFLLLGSELSLSSSLSVYQDRTFYTYISENNFIGFSQNVTAKCKGNTMALTQMLLCPAEERLCKLANDLKSLDEKKVLAMANIKALNQLMALPKPTVLDANTWIKSARLTAEEQSRLHKVSKELKNEITLKMNDFRKQAPSNYALKTNIQCENEIEVGISSGVYFTTQYEANIVDNKEIEVTQYLSLTNSSGIDIVAQNASFYYRSANQYVNPVYFNPWIVSTYVPRSKSMMRKTMMKKATTMHMPRAEAEAMAGDIAPISKVSYEDAREYKITNLTLPSTGVPMNVKIHSWKSTLDCEIRAYPYAKTSAFEVCSFTPKYQIDSHRWKIKSSDIVLNEDAVGEYKNKTYKLYTKVERDIQIQRKAMVKKERETGIFGGTVRKKDGFSLEITNKSDKSKIITLVERIPTSTTEEIKSKLLSVKSQKKVNYKMLKEGQIEMHINLAAFENRKIDVLFEISYDKDLKVSY